jgi:Ca2+-binding EF-hand superfamily protein
VPPLVPILHFCFTTAAVLFVLSQGVIQDKIHHLSAAEKEIVKNLYRLQESANDSERALSLFRHYDRDNSGEIDKDG